MEQKDHYNALATGGLLRDYSIDGVLGSGSFGITYKARERITERLVAIKEYLPNTIATRERGSTLVRPISESVRNDFEWGLDRFRGEAKLLTRLKHPSIVPVLSYFEANCTGYLVMEFQSGVSLGERLAGNVVLSEAEVLKLLPPLLDAIEAVHALGFLHRDIKPDNIYIRTDGSPVLLDFGAARQAFGQHSGGLTAVLTEGYAPYEQYQRDGHQGPWTDIYALGGVLFRSLVGRVPTVATSRLSAWLRRAPDPLSAGFEELRHRCAPHIAVAVECALAVMEQERPQSISDLRRALEKPTDTTKTRAAETTILLTDIPHVSDARSAVPVRRRRVTALVAGLGSLLLTGGAGAYFTLSIDPWLFRSAGDLSPASGPLPTNRDAAERKKAEEEARRKAEEERRKIETARLEREQAEEQTKRKAEEEERKRVEEEARRKAEDEARRKAEDEIRRREEEDARRKSEQASRAAALVAKARALIEEAHAAIKSARLADGRRLYLQAVAAEREAERLDQAAPGLDAVRRELLKLDAELKALIAERIRVLVAEARQHIQSGRYQDAQHVLGEALRLDPASAEAAAANRELAAAQRDKGPTATGRPASRADLPAHVNQAYSKIMQWALQQKTRNLQGAVVENSYRSRERPKALAVCIDWPNSSPAAGIKFGGLGIMERGTIRSVTQSQAVETCSATRPNGTCTCTVVDYNDANVLTFPESYIAKHYQ